MKIGDFDKPEERERGRNWKFYEQYSAVLSLTNGTWLLPGCPVKQAGKKGPDRREIGRWFFPPLFSWVIFAKTVVEKLWN